MLTPSKTLSPVAFRTKELCLTCCFSNRTQSQLTKRVNLTIIDHINKQISVTQMAQSAGIT